MLTDPHTKHLEQVALAQAEVCYSHVGPGATSEDAEVAVFYGLQGNQLATATGAEVAAAETLGLLTFEGGGGGVAGALGSGAAVSTVGAGLLPA